MAYLDVFKEWKTTSVTVTRDINDIVNGEEVETTTTIGTYATIAYKGRQAESVVADKIRERVSMVLIFDVGVDVQERDTCTVSGNKYSVIDADDVAFQGDALVVPVERIS